MKKNKEVLISEILCTALVSAGCAANTPHHGVTLPDKYKDGVYSAQTKPDPEAFYSKAQIKIKDDRITDVTFNIYDGNNRVFDNTYEEVYKNNDTYIQQCRDNMKGIKAFSSQLIKKQNIAKVDAVSGATWAYLKFEEVVAEALKKAQ